MKIITKNIQYLVLLWIFVHPTAIQFLHHHNDVAVFYAYAGDNWHVKPEKCAVCDFHFPIFSHQLHYIHIQKRDITFEKLVVRYSAPQVTSILHVACLRGPPSSENFTFSV